MRFSRRLAEAQLLYNLIASPADDSCIPSLSLVPVPSKRTEPGGQAEFFSGDGSILVPSFPFRFMETGVPHLRVTKHDQEK